MPGFTFSLSGVVIRPSASPSVTPLPNTSRHRQQTPFFKSSVWPTIPLSRLDWACATKAGRMDSTPRRVIPKTWKVVFLPHGRRKQADMGAADYLRHSKEFPNARVMKMSIAFGLAKFDSQTPLQPASISKQWPEIINMRTFALAIRDFTVLDNYVSWTFTAFRDGWHLIERIRHFPEIQCHQKESLA